MQSEVWKLVDGFADRYEISSHGRVKRRAHTCLLGNRWGTVNVRPMPEMIMKPTVVKGYRHVNLWRDGDGHWTRIANLVCVAFNGPRPFLGAITLHGDGNSQNDYFENLRWGTHLENAQDRHEHGVNLSTVQGIVKRRTWKHVP